MLFVVIISKQLFKVLCGRADFAIENFLQHYPTHGYMAMHPLYVHNSVVADYSIPLYQMDAVFMTNVPGKIEPIYNLVHVFDYQIWLWLIVSLITVTSVYSIITKIIKVS